MFRRLMFVVLWPFVAIFALIADCLFAIFALLFATPVAGLEWIMRGRSSIETWLMKDAEGPRVARRVIEGWHRFCFSEERS